MLEIKFKEKGTSRGVASGLSNYIYYYSAMHAYVPKVTITDNPLADYWANLKSLESRFNIPFIGKVYQFDEEASPIFRSIVSSGDLEVRADEYATIKVPFEPTVANLGRMALWGQIISPTGSYVEKVRKSTKTRVETLAKTAFKIPSGNHEISGLLPHAFVECARKYNLIENKEDWTW